MYNIMKALLEAQSQNGEDGQELVEGTITALREFIVNTFGNDGRLPDELHRVAFMLENGNG